MKDIQFDNLGAISELFSYFLIVAAIILGLVIFYTLFFSWKYRKKSDQEVPEQIHDNRKIEYTVITLAFVITMTFLVFTIRAMNGVENIPKNSSPDLVITGHQWWWEAFYANSGVVTANEIHVPTGKKILIQFNSDDVIHSWWIPRLGRKMDLVPGMDNYLHVFIKDEGEYVGSCSEFCGAQHGLMRIRLIAHAPEDFEKWQESQSKPTVSSVNKLFQEGEKLFYSKTCISCHALSSKELTPDIGPNLAHFASRKYFLSNAFKNNSTNLEAWLDNPQKLKPNAKMPDLKLNETEIKALSFYLQKLK